MNIDRQNKYYMGVAQLTALNSLARKRQVGAIIVRNQQIISEGFNGTPAGFDNNCEVEYCIVNSDAEVPKLITKPEVLHAESNAITKCAKYGNATLGATLYVTCSPCIECAKLIIQAGISKVIYRDEYHDLSGVELLKKANIIVEKYEGKD